VEQRDRLRAILPAYERKATGRRRADTVAVFEGIVWLLTSGARWEDWEDIDKREYASFQTCHRYFQEWVEGGVFQKALLTLAEELEDNWRTIGGQLEDKGLLKLHEAFLDGCFVPAKRGATRSASRSGARVAA
jgi:transposase